VVLPINFDHNNRSGFP